MLQLPGRWGHSVSSRSFHQLGLLYAAIALLGGAYAAYDEVTAELERQRDVDYLSIFIPRLGFALIVAFVVYCIVRAVGSVVLRLHDSLLRLSIPREACAPHRRAARRPSDPAVRAAYGAALRASASC